MPRAPCLGDCRTKTGLPLSATPARSTHLPQPSRTAARLGHAPSHAHASDHARQKAPPALPTTPRRPHPLYRPRPETAPALQTTPAPGPRPRSSAPTRPPHCSLHQVRAGLLSPALLHRRVDGRAAQVPRVSKPPLPFPSPVIPTPRNKCFLPVCACLVETGGGWGLRAVGAGRGWHACALPTLRPPGRPFRSLASQVSATGAADQCCPHFPEGPRAVSLPKRTEAAVSNDQDLSCLGD